MAKPRRKEIGENKYKGERGDLMRGKMKIKGQLGFWGEREKTKESREREREKGERSCITIF